MTSYTDLVIATLCISFSTKCLGCLYKLWVIFITFIYHQVYILCFHVDICILYKIYTAEKSTHTRIRSVKVKSNCAYLSFQKSERTYSLVDSATTQLVDQCTLGQDGSHKSTRSRRMVFGSIENSPFVNNYYQIRPIRDLSGSIDRCRD